MKYAPMPKAALTDPVMVGRFWGLVEKTRYCWNWKGNYSGQRATITFRTNERTKRGRPRYIPILVRRYVMALDSLAFDDRCLVIPRCRNYRCVNPAHMWVGLPGEQNKGIRVEPIREVCPQGHPLEGDNLKVIRCKSKNGRYYDYRVCVECRRQAAQRYRERKKNVN